MNIYSSDLTLALYNIDNNKKGLYCGYMDGNSDLTGVARRNSQTSPGAPAAQIRTNQVISGTTDASSSARTGWLAVFAALRRPA